MSIVGEWTIFYRWSCSGSYDSTSITFKADSSFVDGQGGSGNWSMLSGDVVWHYNPPDTATYSGNVIGGAMNGISTDFTVSPPVQGCWYATTPTIPAALTSKEKVKDAERRTAGGRGKK